jgi:lipoprotein-anchoring transpeptidase ErfK/SrfK
MPHTSFAGIDLGMLPVAKAEQVIQEKIDAFQSAPISVPVNGEIVSVLFQDAGIQFDTETLLTQLRDEHAYRWFSNNPFKQLVRGRHQAELSAPLIIDSKKLEETLAAVFSSASTAPKNAALSIKEGKVELIPEKPGFGFDTEKATTKIIEYAQELNETPIALAPEVLPPAVSTSELRTVEAQAESIVQTPFIIVIDEKEHAISQAEVSTWVVYDEAGATLVVNSEAVTESIKKLAAEVDVNAQPKKILKNTEEVVEEGVAGKKLDQPALVQTITARLLTVPLESRVSVALQEIAPEVETVATAATPSTSTGKVIRVVLSEQRLYAYEDGQLARSTLISSGLYGTPTPIGTFSVRNKIPYHVMAGAGYYLPDVPHSMYFFGLYALHGAYWHNNFGNPMSHGCVNLPLDEAEWLFNWATVGTPVEIVS